MIVLAVLSALLLLFVVRSAEMLFLSLTEPPQWVKKPVSNVYSVGSNLVLFCQAIGNPEPTIKWKLNGMPIDGKCRGQDIVLPGSTCAVLPAKSGSLIQMCCEDCFGQR